MKKLILSLIIPSALLVSCGSGNEFEVKGTVERGAEETLLIERSVNGMWFRIDSVKTDGSGNFSFAKEAPAHPEIYRLERNGKFIYFPVDSVDRITIQTDTAGFDRNYTLSGTENAVWMMQVDSVARKLAELPAGDPAYLQAKANFANRILQDPSSIVAYYILNKYIGERPLYSIDNKKDVSIIGAVANAYNTHKPGDPRTDLLKNMFLTGRRLTVPVKTAPADTFYVDESQIVEVELMNAQGKLEKLSEVASKGNVVLLNFTTYAASESPALNAQLAELYRKYASQGFEIYQIGYDDNEFYWKKAAENLPWITVFDPAGIQSQNLLRYNVGALPALFVINRKGELSERVVSLPELDKTIAKYL